MTFMKKICLIVAFFFLSGNILAQESDIFFNPADTIYLPHFGQNSILDSILDNTMGSASNQRSSVGNLDDNTPFHIPIKIWVFHDDNGSNAAVLNSDIELLFNQVDNDYNGTGIQFYQKCEPQHVNSSKLNNITDEEFENEINSYDAPQSMDWYLVRNGIAGTSQFPWKNNNFRFVASFQDGYNVSEGKTVSHEIGHTLGLLHTHENTRGWGNYNGDATGCYQESVSRSRTQGFGCFSTWNDKKCEINGDALCDTEAAPNKEDATSITIDGLNTCNYIGTGTDNWGDDWIPPTRNFMSYLSDRGCRTEFTQHQIAVMQANILIWMAQGGYPFPGLGSNAKPWYNKHALLVSGTVNNNEHDKIISPVSIEIATFPEGIYLLKVESKQVSVIKKIIKI